MLDYRKNLGPDDNARVLLMYPASELGDAIYVAVEGPNSAHERALRERGGHVPIAIADGEDALMKAIFRVICTPGGHDRLAEVEGSILMMIDALASPSA